MDDLKTALANRWLEGVRDHWQSIYTLSKSQFGGGGAVYSLKRITHIA